MTFLNIVLYFTLFITILYLSPRFFKLLKDVAIIKKMPSPHALPLIGTVFYLADTPENVWKKIRLSAKELYPVYSLFFFHFTCANIFSPDDVEIILSSSVNIEKGYPYIILRKWLGTGLLTSTGVKWQHRRKLLTPAFYFNILQDFFSVFVKHTEILIQQLEEECSKESTEITSFISDVTLKSIAETAMGTQLDTKDQKQNEYIKKIHKVGSITSYRLVRPWLYNNLFYRLTNLYKTEEQSIEFLHKFTQDVIQKRLESFNPNQKEKSDSENVGSYSARKKMAMLDLLLEIMIKNADIDENGIREEVDTFMFEGHDTTSASICYSLMLLACNPEIQNTVREEILDVVGLDNKEPTFQDMQGLPYLEMIIKESLRLYPSVPFISRKLNEPVTLSSGYLLPQNTEVNIHIQDLHVNENIWPDPYKFDPNRFLPEATKNRHPFAYIPFSAGPRNCIGQKFAMLEMKTVLSGILRKYRLLPVDTPETIVQTVHLINKTANGIRVKFEKL